MFFEICFAPRITFSVAMERKHCRPRVASQVDGIDDIQSRDPGMAVRLLRWEIHRLFESENNYSTSFFNWDLRIFRPL